MAVRWAASRITLSLSLSLSLSLGLTGCVSFDDLLVADDAGPGDICALQCRTDAVECFCANFDTPGNVSEGWVSSSSGGGLIGVSIEDVQSAPNAAQLTCPGSTTGVIGSAFVVLKRAVQTSARGIRLAGSWKLRPYSRDEPGNFEFFSVALGSSTRVALGDAFATGVDAPPAFRIGVTYTDASGAVITDTYPVSAPPTDTTRWVRFELDVTFADDATGAVRLTWNGAEALLLTDVITSSPDDGGPATLSAAIGGGTLQGLTPDLWMLFDDVVVEVY